jgi:hypothetical protein
MRLRKMRNPHDKSRSRRGAPVTRTAGGTLPGETVLRRCACWGSILLNGTHGKRRSPRQNFRKQLVRMLYDAALLDLRQRVLDLRLHDRAKPAA